MSAAPMAAAWPWVPSATVVGLPQGYVRFGSLAHQVLLALAEHGDLRHADLNELLEADPRYVGMALVRLSQYGFIYARRKVRGQHEGERTQKLWTLEPVEMASWRRLSVRERCRNYRARKALRAPSVFAFRGQIKIEERA